MDVESPTIGVWIRGQLGRERRYLHSFFGPRAGVEHSESTPEEAALGMPRYDGKNCVSLNEGASPIASTSA